jgi:hypothetical protein
MFEFMFVCGDNITNIDIKAFVSIPLILCAFLQAHFCLLFSWGGELCVDSRIFSYSNKYRI